MVGDIAQRRKKNMAYLKAEKAIKKSKKIINNRYDLCIHTMDEILKSSKNDFDLITKGFYVGYLQGYKAARKELGK